MRTILLNASSLKWTTCQRRYGLRVVDGYVNAEDHEYLKFGSALHLFAEERAKGTGTPAALSKAIMSYTGTDMDRLARACSCFPPLLIPPYKESSGLPYIEHKFKVLWKSTAEYQIYVCGTFDIVGLTSDSYVRIVDYKSTRRYKKPEVFQHYATSAQVAFYLWAARRFAHDIFDMTVGNAAHAGRIFMQICAVFLSYDPIQWHPGPLITQPEFEDYEAALWEHVQRTILPAFERETWDPTGKLNNTCGDCEFIDYCYAPTQEGMTAALAAFNKQEYNPLNWH